MVKPRTVKRVLIEKKKREFDVEDIVLDETQDSEESID